MKKCLICGKEFKENWGKTNNFCSLQCYWKSKKGSKAPSGAFKKGNISWLKGTKGIAKANKTSFGKDENHFAWKGEKAGSNAKHSWVYKHKGNAKDYLCINCGKQASDWSNIDHRYRRILEDYTALCRRCHQIYDLKYNHKDISKFNHRKKILI